jgi:hypothetical protein
MGHHGCASRAWRKPQERLERPGRTRNRRGKEAGAGRHATTLAGQRTAKHSSRGAAVEEDRRGVYNSSAASRLPPKGAAMKDIVSQTVISTPTLAVPDGVFREI